MQLALTAFLVAIGHQAEPTHARLRTLSTGAFEFDAAGAASESSMSLGAIAGPLSGGSKSSKMSSSKSQANQASLHRYRPPLKI